MGIVSVCGKRYTGVKDVILNADTGRLYLYWTKSCTSMLLSRPYLLCSGLSCSTMETVNSGVLCDKDSKVQSVISSMICLESLDRESDLSYYNLLPDTKFNESLRGVVQRSYFIGNSFVELSGGFNRVGILVENENSPEFCSVLCTVSGSIETLCGELAYCLGDVKNINTRTLVVRWDKC